MNSSFRIASEIAECDIEIINRVPSKYKEKHNVIVKFHSRKVRDRVLRAAEKERMNTSTLGFKDSSPVFVNQHLCAANNILSGKTLNAKPENNLKLAWVSHGSVHAQDRKFAGSARDTRRGSRYTTGSDQGA